ncbi:MAG TPA: invasion associated locus B family protein [Paracoccaceae bacterium]|nr:invasion associated locus B family protein [Paracoccaceae bacterium]
MRMFKTLTAALAATVLTVGFAAAQDNNSLEDQFPVPGANATAPAAQPQEVVREKFGDWEIRCNTTTNNCFMYQLMLDDENNPVAELSLIKMPLGSEVVAGATVVTPLGTLLTRGLTFRVDDGGVNQAAFGWCVRPGCFARFGLTDLTVEEMRKGDGFNIAIYAIQNARTPVELSASLVGFTAAFEALEPTQTN